VTAMTDDPLDKKIHIRICRQSDKHLFKMVQQQVAGERGCLPDEVGQAELFRTLALYKLNNPEGVEITLNGEAETLLRAIDESETNDPADALEEIAQDSLKLKQRQKATDGGPKYTGGSDA